jgi:hypothetical protein
MAAPIDTAAVRAAYLRTREVKLGIDAKLRKTLDPEALQTCASVLGFPREDGKAVIDTADDVLLVEAFTTYEHRAGSATVKQLLGSDESTEEERVVLDAMRHHWFTVFVVNRIVPEVGAFIDDTLHGGTLLLADVSLAEHGYPGLCFASHLLPFDTFAMTGGACVAFEQDIAVLYARVMQARPVTPEAIDALEPSDRVQLAANLINLARSDAEMVRHWRNAVASGRGIVPWTHPARLAQASAKVGRNDPCPCGSGKKYKKCCQAA